MIEYKCPNCDLEVILRHNRARVFCACGGIVSNDRFQMVGENGVGDCLYEITTELGVEAKESCSCKSLRRKLNKLGVDGCEQQREWIVQQLEANAAKWSWLEVLQIAASNVANPLALAIAFRGNIYHALLDEAIERANRQKLA